jgi:hypothetical protein
VNVLDLDLKQCDVVYGWICMLMSMCFWICECLNLDVDVNVSMNIVTMDLHVDVNECVRFGCIYGCGYTIYYVNLLCKFCNFSCVVLCFCKKNSKPG